MSKSTQVFVIAGATRLLLPVLVSSLVPILSSSTELSTPITSFKALQEAFYFLDHNLNLYDGGVNHHPPLLVIILSFFNSFPYPNFWFSLIYTVTDLLIASNLVQINKWYNRYRSKHHGFEQKYLGFNDDLIACFYLFNPLILLTNLSHSTIVFTWFFIVQSISQIVIKKNVIRSMISLAIASYLSFHSLYLLPSILALAYATSSRDILKFSIINLGAFATSLAILLYASFVCTGSWLFIDKCYTTVVLFKKITPNVGLWWYLFTEMFEFFTPFYTGMFNLYSFVFIIPITLRLFEYRKSPKLGDSFLSIILSMLWVSFTKSYPTIGDLGFVLSILPMFKDTILTHCKMLFITGMTLIISLILSPIFYYCWIVLGNGNSNFFYSINLIWGGVHLLLLMELIWAQLIVDYGVENDLSDEQLKQTTLAQL
ncbi:uncharacterized protein KGF55_002192 [Candida pseudojiufengensis]|uniref:uncharacterized protein n=1 Tax=Candida pseudojiufengensis TaxID=497109 RepID=UPI0022247E56|nr:uncharacterized protein KGF55_002192 [Candida pseudojiufengensis]KAI5964250.1 hypothetical protein KGF55_002192 [Candida pseudojiufengensis]